MSRRPSGAARSFASGAAWLMVGDAFAKIAGLVFVVLVARGLGTVEYGYLNFALSFVPLFLIVATWGIDDALFREVANDRSRLSPLFASGLRLRLAFGATALLLAIAAAPFFVEAGAPFWTIVLIGAALFFDEIASFISTVFKAFEQMKFRALRIGVNRLGTLIITAAVLAAGGSLLMVSGAYLAGSVVALLFAVFALRKYFPPVALADGTAEETSALFKRGAPLAFAAVVSMAVFRIDAILVQAIDGPRAVAMYGVAYRFLDSFLFVAWALANVALPRMTRAPSGDTLSRTFTATWMLTLSFYVPLAVGAPFAADWMVSLVFGERYLPAAAAVPWLMWAGVAYSSAYLARMGLLALGMRKEIAWTALAMLIVNLTGNAFAITRYGFVGAAAVTLVSGALEAVVLTLLLRRRMGSRAGSTLLLAPTAAGVAMGIALIVTGVRDGAAVALGGVVYLVSLAIAVRVITPQRIWEALTPSQAHA